MRTFPKNHDHHQRHLGSHDKWIFKASRPHAVERKEINDFMAEERSHFKPATVSISVILHIECELRRHWRAKRRKKKERGDGVGICTLCTQKEGVPAVSHAAAAALHKTMATI